MVSPLTDSPQAVPAGVLAAPAEASPELLPAGVRRAVTGIAAAAGAWCPALSPDGSLVAYVTDRSGIPRLEVAELDERTPPAVVSAARRGGRLRRLVARRRLAGLPRQPRRLDLRRAARRAPRRQRPPRRRRRRTRAPPSSPAAGPARAHYACSIAPGDGPDADVVLVDAATGAHRTLARGGFLSVTSVSADERFVLARRGPRAHRHVVVVDVATGVQRRLIGLDAPGGVASEDGRFAPDGRSVLVRASLPGEPFTDRAGLVQVPLSEDGVPGEGRVVLSRPDADLDGYAVRTDGTVLAVWNAGGVTELRVHALSDGSLRAGDPAARAGDARLVALRRRHHDGRRADGPAVAARALFRISLDDGAPRPLQSAPPRPDRAGLVTPVRHDYLAPGRDAAVRLAVHPARRARAQPHGRELPRRARRARSGRTGRRSPSPWSPPGSPCSRRTSAGPAASAGPS